MTSATTNAPVARGPALIGQTVVVIGGSAGIGLETARLARAEAADVVVTGRDPERLGAAAREVDARSSAGSTSSRLVSSTRRCPRRYLATGSKRDGRSCAGRSPS